MMRAPEPGELTVLGLWVAVWQEAGSRQCPVSRTQELVPHQPHSWYSKPQLDELGVGMHREEQYEVLLCRFHKEWTLESGRPLPSYKKVRNRRGLKSQCIIEK